LEHEIRGTVTAIAADRKSVTLDHEAIPGLMGAMTMEYRVKDSGLLEGIKTGDRVEGRLQARGTDYLITELRRR
jgi:Cu/Ag efflux protein CusF